MSDEQNIPPRKRRVREAKIGTTGESTDHSISQAKSLLWAATHLQDIVDEALQTPGHDSVNVCRLFLRSRLTKAFATELGLKALYRRESGREPAHEHDLTICSINWNYPPRILLNAVSREYGLRKRVTMDNH